MMAFHGFIDWLDNLCSAVFLFLARNPKNIKKEILQESTSCKKALNAPGLNMGKRLVKRAKIEIEPLPLKSQVG